MNFQGIEFKHLALDSNALVADYLAGREQATRYFGGSWNAPQRLYDLSDELDKIFDRERAARVLAAQRWFGLVENGRELLDRFVKERGYIVTSGQQPVLFGGPLYVLYKCIDLISTAARYSELLERPVLPVFWNASEDHDQLEASTINLPDMANKLNAISLPADHDNHLPLCQLPLGSGLAEAREKLEEITPPTDFRPGLLEIIDAAYDSRTDFGHAFSKLLSSLFAGRGLFVVDACSAEIRREAAELLERELFDSRSSAVLFDRTSKELEAAGYPVQVKPQKDDTALFVLRDKRRVKLQRAGKNFRLKGSVDELSAEQIKRILEDTPEVFSPGVRMRPLVEASLFGSLSYLAGPGEISYYAQMKPLYELRGLSMPLIAPRLAGVIVEPKIAKVLDKYSLEISDISEGAEKLSARLLAQGGELGELTGKIGELRREIASRLDEIGKLVEKLDPTMMGPLKSTGGAVSGQLDKLEGKLTQAAGRRNEELLGQLGKAEVNLWPGGKRQEREISWLYYLIRYGDELIDWLLEQAEEKV